MTSPTPTVSSLEAEGAVTMPLNEFAPVCSECGGVGRGATGREIYPHRPDLYAKNFYRCDCGAYVGCHPGTVKALGSPAGAETRHARSAAHAAFDPIWKRGEMRRGDAYRSLARALGIHPKDCHISWFKADMCARVVAVAPTLATPDGAERVHEQVSQPMKARKDGRGRKPEPMAQRMARYTKIMDDGCHEWTGSKNWKGYGVIRPYGGRKTGAHRIAYELAQGAIPPGIQIDHLCGNRACVNPGHLEAVTPAENNRRSSSPSAINGRLTHCKRGHEFTPETTGRNYRGNRFCLICRPPKARPAAKPKPKPKGRLFGELNANARLKAHEAAEIRSSTASRRELAEAFGVSKSTIDKIKSGRTWPGVDQVKNGGAA